VVDDCFSVDFPAVAEGFARFMAEGTDLVPFAISPDKVFLAHAEHAPLYREDLERSAAPHWRKSTSFYGAEVAVFGPLGPWMRLVRTSLWQRLRRNPTVLRRARLLKRLVGRS
jgi:hypothetical protein